MSDLKWQLVTEWEEEHGNPYPNWGIVWHYDGYGECWKVSQWKDVKDYYNRRRNEPKNKDRPMWDFQFEPMVALPADEWPRWGEGTALKRITKVKE